MQRKVSVMMAAVALSTLTGCQSSKPLSLQEQTYTTKHQHQADHQTGRSQCSCRHKKKRYGRGADAGGLSNI